MAAACAKGVARDVDEPEDLYRLGLWLVLAHILQRERGQVLLPHYWDYDHIRAVWHFEILLGPTRTISRRVEADGITF